MHVGAVVAERFELLRLAGSGGGGTVYQARDRARGQLVAVKLLRHVQPEHIQRFKREVELLARLDAPGFVRYVGSGVLPGGQPFLITEWLQGEDLDARLEHGPLEVAEAVTLATRVAQSLAVAHDHGIIHRDVKPSNIWLVDRDVGRPKILDLGLARFVHADRSNITSTGAIMGTPSYMSPEQARGADNLDARSDVFSLGCVLYECLVGTPPFGGDHVMAVLAKVVFEDAPRVRSMRPDVPRSLDRLVYAMLSRDAARRPPDASAVALALDALQPTESGQRLSSRPPAAPSGSVRLEQRVLCVLTATRPEAEQPDSTVQPGRADLMPQHQVVRGLAEQRGGKLELLANGCLIATFSAAGQPADLALSAARTALALRRELPGFCLALATGSAVVAKRISIGEAVQRTAHLLEEAVAGEIRIDDSSANLLQNRFAIEGRLLIAELDAPRGERLLLGRSTRCVGRDWELSTLEAAFTECVEERTARVALVTGAAGMGKSRLFREFLQKRSSRDALVCSAVGDPLRTGAPFGLLRQALRSCFGTDALLEEAAQRDRLQQRVRTQVEAEDVTRVTDFLGELMGVPLPESAALRAARDNPRLMAEQMFRAWQDWLDAESAEQPVILIFDDMHWGDVRTVEFVHRALQKLGDRPIFVLALGRTEMHDRFPRLWAEHGATELHLRKLPRRACEPFAREMLGAEAANELVQQVITQADGNAFYLEESIRFAAEGKQDWPASVSTVPRQRLAALPDKLRGVLCAASVFGDAFEELAAAGMLEHNEPGVVGEALDELVEREWLTFSRDPPARSKSYTFRHELVREEAYATSSDADRALRHGRAAVWLERAGEPDASVVAQHYERAHDPRAAEWYRRAAEQAMAHDDLETALRRAARGVKSGATGVALGALRLLQAEAHNLRAEWQDAARSAHAAVELLSPGSLPWARAAHHKSWAASARADDRELESLLDQLAAAPRPCSLPAVELRALCVQARTLLALKRFDEAGARAEEALRLLPSLQTPDEFEGVVHLVLAEALQAKGDLSGAETAIASARERLLARAALIDDLSFRESFLRNVPENARTLELAAAWLDDEITRQFKL
ncbi:MAG TPA: protein kinase [Polyangiaceae bacterium]|nr:protein kinase [Polyangiaceae bacterium]